MSKKFKIPEMIRNADLEDKDFGAAYDAAKKHSKHLDKAEAEMSAARDFCETLRGHLVTEEAYAEVTVVERIEKLICKARDRMDRHGTAHRNLFIAYFDLKAGSAK